MKKLYLDRTEVHDGVFIKDAEIIPAGTTIYSMSVKDRNAEYEKYADEYDINFIFDDDIPLIDFYTIPQVDIVATDSQGGFFGTIGQTTDLKSNAPICYIDKDRNCYLIAENGKDFLKCAPMWRNSLKEYNGVTFYNSKSDAAEVVEIIDWNWINNRTQMDRGRSLLQRCIKQGFSIASISMVTQIPEQEIQDFLDNDNYSFNDKRKEDHLIVFLNLFCYEKPEEDKYYKMLLESLTQHFHVSTQAIANYIGISVDELSSFESSIRKDMIEKNIARLFNTFAKKV